MSITKKNGKYYSRFQINGERHHYLCSGATSMKEAEKMESAFKYKLMQQQNGVIPREKKKVRLKTLYDLYDKYSQQNKKSYCADIYFIKVLKSYFDESLYANDLKLSDFEKFKEALRKDRNSSNSTINKYLNALSKMFTLGINEKIITENPLKSIKRFQEANYKIRYLTTDEEIRLFKAVDELFPYLRPLITTALQTGMRKGEIFNLKWSNIDFDYGFIELLETKSGKSRKIPLSDKMKELLDGIEKVSEYVFINPDTGKPYTDIKHSFATVLKEAKIDNFRFHDLRHTVATRLVEKGIDLVVVKEILGHSKIETTMRYAHAVPKRKMDAINVLNSYS